MVYSAFLAVLASAWTAIANTSFLHHPTTGTIIIIKIGTVIRVAVLRAQHHLSVPSSIPAPRSPSCPPRQPRGLGCFICWIGVTQDVPPESDRAVS